MTLAMILVVALISTVCEAGSGRFGHLKNECESNSECPTLEHCRFPHGRVLQIKRCHCLGGYKRSNYEVKNSPCITDPDWCTDAKDCSSGQRCYFIDHRPCDGGLTQGCRNITGRKGGCARRVREVIDGTRRKPLRETCTKTEDCGSKQICRIPDGDVRHNDKKCLCKEGYEAIKDGSGCDVDKDFCRSRRDCPEGQKCYRIDERPCDGGVTNRCFVPGDEKGEACGSDPVEVGGPSIGCGSDRDCEPRSRCRIPDGLVLPIKTCVCKEGYLRNVPTGPCVEDREWCNKRSDCTRGQRCYRLDDRPCDGSVRNRCFQPGNEKGQSCGGNPQEVTGPSNGLEHKCDSDRDCQDRATCRIGDGLVLPIRRCICIRGYKQNSEKGPCVKDKEWCNGKSDCQNGKRCFLVDWRPCDGGVLHRCYELGDERARACGLEPVELP